MPDELGERTEPATERRREEARKEGQIAHSRDLSAAIILLAAVASFQYFGEDMLADAVRITRVCLQEPWLDLEVRRVAVELARLALVTFGAVLPFVSVLMVVAILVEYLQAGGFRVTERNFFSLDRLNPLTGLRRLFSLRSAVRTVVDALKTIVVGSVAFFFIANEMPALANLTALGVPNVAGYTFERMIVLGYEIVAILLVLGAADYAYQRYQYEEDLKMTRQEVKEETRDIEGDPQIKARRRAIQLRMARQRMIQQVPEAEVVITNPTELAVALKYDVGKMDAPVVVAKGAGRFAQRIRELALEHKVPLIENKPLARLLFFKTDVGRVIPVESFVLVAEILAYVYQITKRELPPPPPERPGRGPRETAL